MGAGTNSGKKASAVTGRMQTNFEKSNATIRANIMNAKWTPSTTAKNVEAFNVPGYGGARVEAAIDAAGNRGFLARIWTANSNTSPVNGGNLFPNAAAAKTYAKKALVIRVNANKGK